MCSLSLYIYIYQICKRAVYISAKEPYTHPQKSLALYICIQWALLGIYTGLFCDLNRAFFANPQQYSIPIHKRSLHIHKRALRISIHRALLRMYTIHRALLRKYTGLFCKFRTLGDIHSALLQIHKRAPRVLNLQKSPVSTRKRAL